MARFLGGREVFLDQIICSHNWRQNSTRYRVELWRPGRLWRLASEGAKRPVRSWCALPFIGAGRPRNRSNYVDDSSGSLSFADPLPKPDSPAACQQVVDAIEAWKRVAYGVHYQGPPGPQPTTVKGFDLLTESLVAWCDAYLPGMDAACLMEYREIRVQWESVQANPSHPWDWRPTDGELDKARRMADG